MWMPPLDTSVPPPDLISREGLCTALSCFRAACDQMGPDVVDTDLELLGEAVDNMRHICPPLADEMAEHLDRALESAWLTASGVPF